MIDDLNEAVERARSLLDRQERLEENLVRLGRDLSRLGERQNSGWWLAGIGRSVTTSSDSRPRGRGQHPPVTIVIPVHNAAEELEECIKSLSRHTTHPAALLLIDDASTDPRIRQLLELTAGLGNVRVSGNVENMGFTATVNRGFRLTAGDVVLLNSDTSVGPRWLEQLINSAYSRPDVATVTPVSDNAGAFSVPVPDQASRFPIHLGVADIARLFTAGGCPDAVETPTGNGFCLYLKRAALIDVGEFDAESFPRGYGEENDFCMRAIARGWKHLMDGRTFVHHEREASFGSAKAELSRAARETLERRYPDYGERVRTFMAASGTRSVRESASKLLAAAPSVVRLGLLFVIHDGGGGSIATNLDLMGALLSEFDCYVFSSDRHTLRLRHVSADGLQAVAEWTLTQPLRLADFSRDDYREIFAGVLDRVQPELVHVRHLFKHTLDAPKLAAERLIPVVMSVHDHYTICPTIHLLDNEGRYCAGICTPGHGTCQTLATAGRLPPLKHAFVYQWQEEMDAALRCVSAFITTSPHTLEVHRRALPSMRDGRFELIEHGRDLEQARGLAYPPEPGGKIRILVPGNLDRHKGAELIASLLELDESQRLELHFAGEVPQRYRQLGVMHGAYDRGNLLERVREVRPHFIGIFSIVAETYNHALTEAWGAGLPALATDIGAQGERIRAHGGGFLLSPEDPAAALEAIYAAADDLTAYEREAGKANLRGIPTVAEMAEQYAFLYRDVLDGRRSFTAAGRSHPLGTGIWRMGVLLADPSAATNVLARYRHPEVEWKLRARPVAVGDWQALDGLDVLMARDPDLGLEEATTLIEILRGRKLPLVLEVTGPIVESLTPQGIGPTPSGLETLLRHAALTITNTPALTDALGAVCDRIELIPDQIDERLFTTQLAGAPSAPAGHAEAQPLRVLCATDLSGEELKFFDQVHAAAARARRPFTMDLVSAAPEIAGVSWCRAWERSKDYASYVHLIQKLSQSCDLAVAPILDPDRARHHGDLAYLEYAVLGLPGIYSARSYGSVEHGVTGVLAARDVAEWNDAIEWLRPVSRREAMANAAWASVSSTRLLRQGAPQLLRLIGSVLEEIPFRPATEASRRVADARIIV